MSWYAILNMVTIAGIILSVGCIQYTLASMRYKFYFIAVRAVFYGDLAGLYWLKKHGYYLWYLLLMMAMIGTVLTLIGQFMADNIFVKKDFTFICSALLWISMFFVLKSSQPKKQGSLR